MMSTGTTCQNGQCGLVKFGLIILAVSTFLTGITAISDNEQNELDLLLSEVPVFIFGNHQITRMYLFEKNETDEEKYFRLKIVNTRRKRDLINNNEIPIKDDSEEDPFSYNKLGIDLLLLVDDTVYEHFYASVDGDEYAAVHGIHQYYTSVLFELARIYNSQRLGKMKFKIYPVGIFIAKTPADSPWTKLHINRTTTFHGRQSVDAFQALRAFRRWIKDEIENLPKHDHAMAFTRMDISRFGDHKAQGIAYVKSICREGEAVSLVEDVGAMATVAIAGHELAHSLGAEHDGAENFSSVCLPRHNYLMVPSVSASRDTLPNTFTFSECTIEQIRNHVVGHPTRAACLYHSNLADVGYRSIDNVGQGTHPGPGLTFDANQQCQRAFGLTFRFCGDNDYYLKQMCRQLWCRNITLGRRSTCFTKPYLPALSGTSCGHQLLCRYGACVYDEKAPPLQQTCKFGDRDSSFCWKLVTADASRCKVPTFQRFCCQTCKEMQMRRKRRRLRNRHARRHHASS